MALSADRPVRVAAHRRHVQHQGALVPVPRSLLAPPPRSDRPARRPGMPSAGFYPRGGGRLDAWIEPATPAAAVADRRGPCSGPGCRRGVPASPQEHRRADARPGRRVLAERGLEADIAWSTGPALAPGRRSRLTAEHEGGSPPRSSASASAASPPRRSPTRPSRSCSPTRTPPAPSTPTRPTSSSCRWPSPTAAASTPSPRSPSTSAPTPRRSAPSSTARSDRRAELGAGRVAIHRRRIVESS